jgi:hypothetical protein
MQAPYPAAKGRVPRFAHEHAERVARLPANVIVSVRRRCGGSAQANNKQSAVNAIDVRVCATSEPSSSNKTSIILQCVLLPVLQVVDRSRLDENHNLVRTDEPYKKHVT